MPSRRTCDIASARSPGTPAWSWWRAVTHARHRRQHRHLQRADTLLLRLVPVRDQDRAVGAFQGMTVCIAGVTIGLAMTLAAARIIGSVLYGISGADPLTYLVVPPVLLGAALLACYLPARQVTTVQTVEALRADWASPASRRMSV